MTVKTTISNDPSISPEMLRKSADLLKSYMESYNVEWDECFFRQEHPTITQTSWDKTYRIGRTVEFFPWPNETQREKVQALETGFEELFDWDRISEERKAACGVAVLVAQWRIQILYDLESTGNFHIRPYSIGLRASYFTREDIDPAEHFVKDLDELARWERLLEGKPVLQVLFPINGLGLPCLEDSRALEIFGELQRDEQGKVVSHWIRDNEMAVEIGVMDLDTGVARITTILRKAKAPKGTTLRQIEPETVEYPLDLKDKKELFHEESNRLVTELLSESVKCSPAKWKNGTLTINFDGSRVEYKLKNPNSTEPAQISGALRKLCEEFCILMWSNGQQWIESEIAFVKNVISADFKVNFKYNDDVPDKAPAKTSRWGFLRDIFPG